MTLMLSAAISLSPRAFKALGIEEIAHIKPIIEHLSGTRAVNANYELRPFLRSV